MANNDAEDELNNYINIRCADPKDDPCEWWKERKTIFSKLSKLVYKYLHISGISVPSEHFFSDTRNHIIARHTWLDSNLLHKIVFLKQNIGVIEIFPSEE